jgi:hypothetical protein
MGGAPAVCEASAFREGAPAGGGVAVGTAAATVAAAAGHPSPASGVASV